MPMANDQRKTDVTLGMGHPTIHYLLEKGKNANKNYSS